VTCPLIFSQTVFVCESANRNNRGGGAVALTTLTLAVRSACLSAWRTRSCSPPPHAIKDWVTGSASEIKEYEGKDRIMDWWVVVDFAHEWTQG